MTVDALARHRMLLLAGVPVTAPPRMWVEGRADEPADDLEEWDDEDDDEELDEEDEDLEDEDEESDAADEDLEEEQDEDAEDLEDSVDEVDEPEVDETDDGQAVVSDAAAARDRLLRLAGVELRARARTNPAPGRQVTTREGEHKYGLPIGSTILPGVRELTEAQQHAVAALPSHERGKYAAARQRGATHAAAMKAALHRGPDAQKMPNGTLLISDLARDRIRGEHADGARLSVQALKPGDQVKDPGSGRWRTVATIRQRDRFTVSAFDVNGDEIFHMQDHASIPTRKAAAKKAVTGPAAKKVATPRITIDDVLRLRGTDPDGLAAALETTDLGRLRTLFREFRIPEPGSHVAERGPADFVLPPASQRADAVGLRVSFLRQSASKESGPIAARLRALADALEAKPAKKAAPAKKPAPRAAGIAERIRTRFVGPHETTSEHVDRAAEALSQLTVPQLRQLFADINVELPKLRGGKPAPRSALEDALLEQTIGHGRRQGGNGVSEALSDIARLATAAKDTPVTPKVAAPPRARGMDRRPESLTSLVESARQPGESGRPAREVLADLEAKGTIRRQGDTWVLADATPAKAAPRIPAKGTPARDALDKRIASRYAAGESLQDIASSEGVSASLVHTALTTQGVQLRPRGGAVKKAVGGTTAKAATPRQVTETARRLREEAKTESDAIRILAADQDLSSARLRQVAAEMGIEVPPDMRAKTSLQLHIAQSVARERGLPSTANLVAAAAAKKAAAGGADWTLSTSEIDRKLSPYVTHNLATGQIKIDEEGLRRDLAGLTVPQLKRIAREFSLIGPNSSLPPAGTRAGPWLDWLLALWQRETGTPRSAWRSEAIEQEHRAAAEPYGDVKYADPGYQADGKKRYPLDSEAHCRAAWSYINQADNAARYSPQQLKRIKSRIVAAGKRYGVEFAYSARSDEEDGELRLAGQDVIPGHDELHHYWTRGEGLAKWRDHPHPWTALYHHLLKYVNPEMAKRMASRWFIEVFGYSAGSDLHRIDSGKPPRGHLVGPG